MSNKTPKSSDAKTESAPKTAQLLVLVVIAVLLLMSSVILFGLLPDRTLTIDNKRINVTIARTSAEREQGLSGRDRLGDNEGMLFVFDSPSPYCFWMKDMNFPIDMIWLDENKKVITIKENATPESYPEPFCPIEDAQYVLEIGVGKAREWGIERGDQAQFKR